MNIQTVYIFPGISESAQMANAKQKAVEHDNGLVNICYHRHYEPHNKKCCTFDVRADEDEKTKSV